MEVGGSYETASVLFLGGSLVIMFYLSNLPSLSSFLVKKVNVPVPVGTLFFMKGNSFWMSTLGFSSRRTSIFLIESWAMNEANEPSGFTPECATVLALNLSGPLIVATEFDYLPLPYITLLISNKMNLIYLYRI